MVPKPTERKTMKILLIGVSAAAIVFAPLPIARADTGYKFILNGKEIGQGSYVVCHTVGVLNNDLTIMVGQQGESWGNANAELRNDTLVVGQVNLRQNDNGTISTWATVLAGPHPDPVVPTATKNGNTYKITGTLRPITKGGLSANGNPTPFEFDATCP